MSSLADVLSAALQPRAADPTQRPSMAAVVAAYRQLYRHGLRAVQYSTPSRFILRDRLRRAFRENEPAQFEPGRVANTLEFLRCAAREKGLEHRMMKSILFVWYYDGDVVHLGRNAARSGCRPMLDERRRRLTAPTGPRSSARPP